MYVYVQTQPSYSDSSNTCNGSASAIVYDYTANPQNNYQYLWNTGAATQTINNLCPGYYCVTVTDVNGFVASACAFVDDYTYWDSTNVVIPTDTAINSIDTCFITGVIDSAWVDNVFATANGVYVEWVITQDGTTTTFTLLASIDSAGTYVVILNITCNGYKYSINLKDIVTVTNEDLQIEGIENNRLENINIYPNPASEYITIDNAKNANYELYNIQGMKVQSGKLDNSSRINIASLASGSYFVRINNSGISKIGRFVK